MDFEIFTMVLTLVLVRPRPKDPIPIGINSLTIDIYWWQQIMQPNGWKQVVSSREALS
jgi:hypothetical protein